MKSSRGTRFREEDVLDVCLAIAEQRRVGQSDDGQVFCFVVFPPIVVTLHAQIGTPRTVVMEIDVAKLQI